MEQSKESIEFKKFFPKMKDDRYEYLGHLGKGRAGQVFKARDKLLKKKIVIKVMCSEVPKQEDFQRFQREARAFSSLQHPNILRVLDFGLAEDQTPYLVTDFVEGLTIAEYLKKEKIFSPEQTIEIGIQLCNAMHHSHKRGVLHRDLKPSNILLTGLTAKTPHVYILDFGLAKFTDMHHSKDNTLTKPGQILGTAEYMSPEQSKGIACGETSDIYSLACILFEMVSGKPPFQDRALLEVVRMQCEEPPPMEKIDKVSPRLNLRSVLAKALEKKPQDRYLNMGELETSLKELKDKNFAPRAKPLASKPATNSAASSAQSRTNVEKKLTDSSVMKAPQISTRKLKIIPVVIICVLLTISFVFLMSAIINQNLSFDYSSDPKVDTIKKKLSKKSRSNDAPNLVHEAMLLSEGELSGSTLTLAGQFGADTILQEAARTGRRISVIDASRSTVTDKGMGSILSIRPKTLILSGTVITDKSIYKLRGNRNLEHLIIDEIKAINGQSFKIFPTITNLRVLCVGGKNLTNKVFSSLFNCKSLDALCINSSPNLTNEVFQLIGSAPKLSTLYIGNCSELTNDGFAKLKELKPYIRIVQSANSIPVEKISELNSALESSKSQGFLD